jgi:hypothetical protein
MDKLILNVYDEKDKIIKTSEAQLVDLRFGTIRSLMELLNVDDMNDTGELLKTVYGAWSQIIAILGRVFPDMTDEDWENIKLSELLPILVVILKSSFAHILTIPNDSKN